MLVLSRKAQEQIRIGENITISVLKIKGNSVQIGIEAPREVPILRGELPVFSRDAGCSTNAGFSKEASAEASDDSEAAEYAAATDDEPALSAQPSASLQSYLRLRRRRRHVLECAG